MPGVSWKVYNDPTGLAFFNPLPYFKAYEPTTTRGAELAANALAQNFPAGFAADVAANTLPEVSWIHGPIIKCEHPATAPPWGENLVKTVLDILTSNPEVWASTLFILNYDENGGFFDHVPPPVAPAGTPGEYLTVNPLPSTASGIAGPVGLGFRVPCILMSPFTRGGYLASDTFDHTSTLRFIETRFGVTVPNLSAWRRSAVGDLTSALALGQAPVDAKPDAAPGAAPQRPGRRGGHRERAARDRRRGHPLPAADVERHAHPGHHARPFGAAPVGGRRADPPPAREGGRPRCRRTGAHRPGLLRTPGRGAHRVNDTGVREPPAP